MKQRLTLLVITALALAACSGGDSASDAGDESSADQASTTGPVSATDADTDTVEPDAADADADAPDTASATTEPPPPTTTTLPPEPYPAGVVWSDPAEVLSARPNVYPGGGLAPRIDFVHVGDELWVLAEAANGTAASRSLDGGSTWAEVVISPSPADGRLEITHVVPTPGGGYLAVATRRSNCSALGPDRSNGPCTRARPVVFTSPDASTWVETAPPGLAPPAGNNLEIEAVVATGDGVIAAGTVIGPQWTAVLFSSPDGVTWNEERRFTEIGNYSASADLAYDGETLTFVAEVTTCGSPYATPSGWALGAGWERHGRILTGTDIASLTLEQPGVHPLAPEPLAPPSPPPVCEGLIDDIPYTFYPYPTFDARSVGGDTTIIERFISLEQRELLDEIDEDPDVDGEALRAEAGSRRYATWVDGEWQLTEIDGVRIQNRGFPFESFFEFDGTLAFAQAVRDNAPISEIVVITADGQVRSERNPVMSDVADITAVGDTLLAVGVTLPDPFDNGRWDTVAPITVWRSAAGEGPTEATCDLVPGGTCREFDLTTHPDYPDFSDRDLAGVDLAASHLGGAVFDGADLSGARLWATEGGDEWPTFVGANLTDAQLQTAEIGDLSGATLVGTNLRDASIRIATDTDFSAATVEEVLVLDATGSTFDGTSLDRASIVVDERFIDLSSVTFERLSIRIEPTPGVIPEVDLSGLDLSGLRLEGPTQTDENDGVFVIVTSLDGAILDGTTFDKVDLSRVDPAIDLTEVRVDVDDVICPDGLPPEGESFRGTCVRGG